MFNSVEKLMKFSKVQNDLTQNVNFLEKLNFFVEFVVVVILLSHV